MNSLSLVGMTQRKRKELARAEAEAFNAVIETPPALLERAWNQTKTKYHIGKRIRPCVCDGGSNCSTFPIQGCEFCDGSGVIVHS